MKKNHPKSSAKTKKMTDKKSLEESLSELESIVKKLEGGDLPLEESLVLFEGGVKLYKECKESLDKADKRIAKLTSALKEEDLSE